MSSSKIIEQSYQELVKRTRTKTNVVKGKGNDNKCGEIWVRRNDEEEEINTLLKTTAKAINSLSNSGKVYQNNDKQLQSILKVKSSNNQNSKRSNKEQVIWLKQKEFAVDESSEIENSNNTQSDWESVSSGSYYLGDNRANRQICSATAFQPSSTDDDDENDDTQSVRSFSSQPTNSDESRSSLTSADSVSLSSQLSPRLATSTATVTATARSSCIKNVRFVLNNKNDDISACQKAVEMSSAKNKSNKQNTKRVDFLDSKISSFKSNLLNDNHCSILLGTTHKKLKCLSANSSTTSTNKLELEQQQQQQQSISSSPPPGVSAYNEDLSLADSNISSYSSEVHCSSSSSSSSSSCTKRPTKLITTPPQPTTPTQKQVVTAVTITSSTTSSSGVGSSNISSASSTTSETPSTENLINPTTRHQTPSSINTNRHSIATTTSTSSSYKVAPKAVILDGDGDIEIEIPKTVTTSQPPQLPLTNPPEHKQTAEQPRLRKSAAFFKSPERIDDEMRKSSHRNSNYLITSRDNFNHLQLMHLQQQYQQQQQQQQQKQFYQTNALQREYNNRLAAAAAAAAEMDKERQKGALLEYVKSQQLKQQQQQQMKIRQHQQYGGDQSRKYPPAENTITQPYSNILPRKQINSANRKELDFAIAASKAANNENQARAISLRCQSSNSSNHNHNQNQNTAANRATIFVFNQQQQKPQQQTTANKPNSSSSASTSSTASSSSAASTSSASSTSSSGGEGYDHPIMPIHHPKTAAGQFFVSMQQRPTSTTTVIKTTPAKQRNDSLGLCYLMYGPETKRTLLPSQVTGIDTVKALFVRAFPDKLTMNYLDDEQLVKIYIKDQLKDLFYQLDDMNDIKDRCVLKLVELKAAINSSQLSLTSNCTLTNNNQSQHQNGTIKKNQSSNSSTTATTFTNCYGYESSVNLANAAASNSTDQNGNGVDQTYHYYGGVATASQQPQKQPNQDDSNLLLSSSAIHRSLSEPRPQSMIDVGQYQQQQQQQQQPNHIQLTQSNFTSPISPQSAYIHQQQGYINDPRVYMRSKPHHMKMIETVPEYYVTEGSPSNSNGHIVGASVETYDNLEANGGHQSRIDANGRFVQAMPPPPPPPPPPTTSAAVAAAAAANQRLQELQFNYYDRYNNQMRPIYNSVRIANHQRDIKSVDRDPIYAQVLANGMVNGVAPSANSRAYKTQVLLNGGQTNNAAPNNRSHVLMGVSAAAQKPYSSVSAAYTSHKHRQSLLNVPFMNDSRGVTRDIRSCEREYALADLSVASSSSSKSGSNNKSKSRNVAESVNNNNTTLSIDEETSNDKNGEETGSEQIPTIEVTRESRKATKPTAKRTNYTEEDEENYPSETEVETTNDPTTTNGMDEDMDRTINDNKSEQDIFDDASSTTAVINYQGQQNNGEVSVSDETPDDSKAKIALMQKQLQQLTELVQSALVNRDFSQLVVAANTHLNLNGHAAAKHQQQKSPIKKQQQRKVELSALNQKTNSIRSDLNGIKRMQENFSSSFGASIKSFVNELNDKLKMFCLNEINEKFRLDLIVQKYQLDSSKIEHELSDLECVVDDLRESILKHKCKVSIDDVECYALALSQLSKQLVGLKTSFSGIKDQFRIQLNNNQKSENNDVAYEWQNRFLSVESCKLDMIIKRCKRITGILILLKKLAITSRSQQSLMPIKINEMKRSSSPSSQSPPSLANDSLVADDEKTSEIEQKRAQDAIDQLKKIQLLKEIESLKPDHEQRQLAIEVDDAFNQLMNEISMITDEISCKNGASTQLASGDKPDLNSHSTPSSSSTPPPIPHNPIASFSILSSINFDRPMPAKSGSKSTSSDEESEEKYDNEMVKEVVDETVKRLEEKLNPVRQLVAETETPINDDNMTVSCSNNNANECNNDENENDADRSDDLTTSLNDLKDDDVIVDETIESELTMKKRNQYRAKKNQLKEEKEQQQQQQNKQNQVANSTLSSSPSSFSSQSSSASSSASSSPKLIPNGQQLQIVDTTSISIEPVAVNRLGNTTSIQVVQVNGKSSANVLPTTTTLPQTVISKTNGIDRQSYLETVHEEDVPTTNVAEQSQPQQTSEEQQQQNVEKVKSSISIQPNVEPTTEPTSTNSATFSTNNNTETTSSLYQQLNDLKPIRATRNFKSSTCICLNIKEPLITDSASAVVSSCSMLITTPTISEKNGVELSSNETNGNINGASNETSAKLAPSCLSFPTSKTNSTTYISLNKSSPVASSKSISLRVNELKAAAGVNGDETSSSPSSSTSSSNVISRRNSSFLPSTTSSYTVNNSINLNGGGNSNAPRRVSLSVTDL